MYFKSTLKSVCIVHGHASHGVLTDVLLYLDNKLTAIRSGYLESIMNFGQYLFRILPLGIEENVDNRTDDLGNVSINL